jgi:hypothetical protein
MPILKHEKHIEDQGKLCVKILTFYPLSEKSWLKIVFADLLGEKNTARWDKLKRTTSCHCQAGCSYGVAASVVTRMSW